MFIKVYLAHAAWVGLTVGAKLSKMFPYLGSSFEGVHLVEAGPIRVHFSASAGNVGTNFLHRLRRTSLFGYWGEGVMQLGLVPHPRGVSMRIKPREGRRKQI